jgi:ABC-type sulfate transport system substrate-binding protein
MSNINTINSSTNYDINTHLHKQETASKSSYLNKQISNTPNKNISDYQITRLQQEEYLSPALIAALRKNNKEKVLSIVQSDSFNLKNQEAIIELMATILIEAQNVKLFNFLHDHAGLDFKQKKTGEGHPKFYCMFYAIVKIGTEKNLPKIKKMLNKLFKLGFVPLNPIDKQIFLQRCEQYRDFTQDINFRDRLICLLGNISKIGSYDDCLLSCCY